MTGRTVAVIGLGAMGLAMAKRLAERQHRVIGFDIRPEPMAALEAAGGHSASDAAAAARAADIVISIVVNAAQTRAILLDGGVLDAMAAKASTGEGQGAVFVSMATMAPADAAAIGADLAARGVGFVDAPVSGGVAGIEAGTLTIMAAAPKATFELAQPLLKEIGSNTYHLGETYGQGSAMKTVNQLLAGVHIAAAGEALALAEAEGIDPRLALEILSGSAASSWMLKDRGPRMIAPGKEVRSAIDIFVKDLKIVDDTGHARRFGLPLATAALQLYLAASGAGHGREDDSQIIAHYRRVNRGGGDGAQ